MLEGIETELTSIESEPDTSAQAKATITGMRATITSLKGLLNKDDDAAKKQRTDLANKLLEDATKLSNFLRNNAPPYAGTNRWPIPGSVGLGSTPHGYSPYYGKVTNPDKATHDVVGGFGNKSICDALDIAVSENSHPDVFPVFDGKIVLKRKLGGQIHDVVIVSDNSGNYKALYTDIQTDKNVGSAVTTTESFAKVSARTVMHLQISYKDNCIVTTAGEVSQFKNNKPGKPATYGTYMQAHIQAVFSNFVKP
jgi:hypothetical protein